MENTTKPASITELVKLFTEIYSKINHEQLAGVLAEMRKVVPSDTSEVFMTGGCCVDDNDMTFTVYVTNPKQESETKGLSFVEIIFQWFINNNFEKLQQIAQSVRLIVLNNQIPEKYNIEYMPVRYSEKIQEFVFHFVIYKDLGNEKGA